MTPDPAVGTGFVAGRDYWPDDVRANGYMVLPFGDGVVANAADIFFDRGEAWVLLGGLDVAPLDRQSGLIDYAARTSVVRPGESEDAADRDAIANASIRRCTAHAAADVPLTRDAVSGLWHAPNLGIDPDTLVLDGGGSCTPELGPQGILPGHRDAAGARTLDEVDVTGCDADVTASYNWTTCSFEGLDAWHCPLDADLDGNPGTTEYGACAWFVVYEGNTVLAEPSETMPTQYDLRMYLAHGASLRSSFVKYTADGTNNPARTDARVSSTQPNRLNDIAGSSWASVPSLYWDPADQLWRMYFSAEGLEAPAESYSESADDGLTWGIGGHYAPTVDCWDDAAGDFDPLACRSVTWAEGAEPPDDPTTDRTPDVVDGQVIPWPGPEAEDGGVMLLFSGADARCAPSPRWSNYAAGFHPDGGDLTSDVAWTYVDSVLADPDHGAILSPDRSDPECADLLHDFTVAQDPEGRYIMLYQPVWRRDVEVEDSDGVYLSASGYACSNYADDDGDGLADYGADPDCDSPLDDEE